ncbi:MAG TPA: efflux RND transporter periplasmic adaptor subunit [Acidobacteriota bacterium]|nr:efflux RND transporter periplasmic adaptor subunit [Acidobacteriota bacterium]
MKRLVFCLATALLAPFLSACRQAETQEKALTPVMTREAELLTLSDELRYSGNVMPNIRVDLAFKVGGYVSSIHRVRGVDGRQRDVDEGDPVRQGTVLATVRQQDYTDKVSQAQSQLSEAQSTLATAKSQLVEAQATAQQAELDFNRAQNLFSTQSLTKSDYDSAKTRLDVSRARVDSAKGQVQAADSRMAGAQALVSQAELALADTELRAPLDAVVMKRLVEVGSLVGSGSGGLVLADISSVKVVFGAPDTIVPKLQPGTSLRISTEAIPGTQFLGRITQISPSADVKSRVFDVELTVPNRDLRLKPGMIATVIVSASGPARQELVLPLSSILRSKTNPDGYAVYVVRQEGGKQVTRLRDVTLGEPFGNAIAVRAGVQAGERVVTNGSTMLTDGEAVRVVP